MSDDFYTGVMAGMAFMLVIMVANGWI